MTTTPDFRYQIGRTRFTLWAIEVGFTLNYVITTTETFPTYWCPNNIEPDIDRGLRKDLIVRELANDT